MRIWVKRVVFSTQKLFEVRLCESGVANPPRVRRKVAEALGAAADHAGDAADEITQRERVNKTEQVPNDNLAEVQAQPLGIDDSTPQHPFADGLTAPGPFQRDPIAEREEEEEDDLDRLRHSEAQEAEQGNPHADGGADCKNTDDIDQPGAESSDGARQQLGEDHSLRRLDQQSVGLAHRFCSVPQRPRKMISRISSTRPKPIFNAYGRTGSWYWERKASTIPAQISIRTTPKIRVTRSRASRRSLSLTRMRCSHPINAPASIRPAWPPIRIAGISITPCGRSQASKKVVCPACA